MINRASEVIKNRINAEDGRVRVSSISGRNYEIIASTDGRSFLCRELPISPPYEFSVFDIIVDLLRKQNGKAKKGNGRNFKLGEPGCEESTIVGAVARFYSGKDIGQSVFDPVFVLVSVLDWAGVAHNHRGYVELTPEWRI